MNDGPATPSSTAGIEPESPVPFGAEVLRSAWSESERRLYPLATTEPHRYEQAIRLVRATANALAEVEGRADLLQRWPHAGELVHRVSAEVSLPLQDLPAEHVAGAAFALRDAELRVEEHRRSQQVLIERAQKRGQAWVVLHERGSLEAGLENPFQRTEMHLGTGLAMVSNVEIHPTTGGPNYVLMVARLNSDDGTLVDPEPDVAGWSEHRDVAEFRARRDALIALIEQQV